MAVTDAVRQYCPYCDRRDFKSKSGKTRHIRAKHPEVRPWDELVATYGTCRACGAPNDRQDETETLGDGTVVHTTRLICTDDCSAP